MIPLCDWLDRNGRVYVSYMKENSLPTPLGYIEHSDCVFIVSILKFLVLHIVLLGVLPMSHLQIRPANCQRHPANHLCKYNRKNKDLNTEPHETPCPI